MQPRPSVSSLVAAAGAGDGAAWNALVDRYAGLVVSVCRSYRLGHAGVADVSQTVWLRLVERLGSLRDPEALAGWLVTTTRNEAMRVTRVEQRQEPIDFATRPDTSEPIEDAALDALLAGERRRALWQGFADLSQPCQALLAVFLEDPPPAYEEIATRLSMPIGSIGPTRSRCLDRLRRTQALAALLEASAGADTVKS